MTSDRAGLERLLANRLVVCLGSGGVGKTTVAAALGIAAARRAREAAVITVDPARRLKDALGLDALSSEPHRVELGNGAGGRIHFDALALDTKRVFDALIERVSPSPELAARIQANRLYQELSNELGGSTEYMAMEKLYELLHQERYQLVVVDTPPSSHARDLLSAPRKMMELLASSAVRILKTPASLLWGSESRLARIPLNALLKALERWTGLSLLQDLADFVGEFEQLADGFRSRAEEVEQALRRPDTSFVVVTSPEPDTIAATLDLHRELADGGFPIAGVIANRVLELRPLERGAGKGHPEPLRRKLRANYEEYAAIAARDRRSLDRLQEQTGAPLLAALPAFADAPASLAGLERLASLLLS